MSGFAQDWGDWPGNAAAVDTLRAGPIERQDTITIGMQSLGELGRDAQGELPRGFRLEVSFPDGRVEVAYADGAWRPLYAGTTVSTTQRRATISLRRKTGWYKAPTLDLYDEFGDPIEYGYGTEPEGFPAE